MIYAVPREDVVLPFNENLELCLENGFLNPDQFAQEFRTHGWFPFEDFTFSQDEIEKLIRFATAQGNLYRCNLPCRDREIQVHRIKSPTRLDAIHVEQWLAYDEGVLWGTAGELIINSYSDFVLLSISDKLSQELFNSSVQEIFESSQSIFVNSNVRDPIVAEFMDRVEKTWL